MSEPICGDLSHTLSKTFDFSKLEIDGFDRYVSPAGKDAMCIRWSCDGLGFGELTVVKHPNGQIELDTEAMSGEFVDLVMGKLRDLVTDAGKNVDRWAHR